MGLRFISLDFKESPKGAARCSIYVLRIPQDVKELPLNFNECSVDSLVLNKFPRRLNGFSLIVHGSQRMSRELPLIPKGFPWVFLTFWGGEGGGVGCPPSPPPRFQSSQKVRKFEYSDFLTFWGGRVPPRFPSSQKVRIF